MILKSKLLYTLATGVLASASLMFLGATPSASTDFTMPGVYLCSDSNYGGGCSYFAEGNYPVAPMGMNDYYSSVKIVGDYEVQLFKDTNYLGTEENLYFDDPTFDDNNIGNDNISSLKVYKLPYPRTGVYFYKDANITGDSLNAKSAWNSLPVMDNAVSSFIISGRYKVTLYSEPNLTGSSITFYPAADGSVVRVNDLVPYGFNDKMSSFDIQPY